MDKKFLVYQGMEYTYKKLVEDLNAKNEYSSYLYIKNNDPYNVFLSIIHSLLYGYPVELIDGDLSKKELFDLGIEQSSLSITNKISNRIILNDINSLYKIITKSNEWYLSLYTSGTTGKPKKVSHNLKLLTRNVKCDNKFYEDVWSFSYNPTHMAGLQVFFQAFLNQNTIIYTFDELPNNIPLLFDKYKITHISATPTFYRSLFPFVKQGTYKSVRRVTFGGEKIDQKLEKYMKDIFPNAKISNIYASTEAGSLFNSHGDVFEIKTRFRDLVNINDKNELLLHNSLLGKFESFDLEGEWFNTGDIVEVLDSSHFRFLARQSELINVGGYKVNPIEVENTLIEVPGIHDILVKARNNSVTGQIVVADIIIEESYDEKELKGFVKKFASTQLQEWKVPRIINFVNEIPRTRTGKKVRK